MSTKALKILCVDDESDLIDILREVSWPFDLEVVTATNVDEALTQIRKHGARLALVLSDFAMPGANAFDLRRAMAPDHSQIPFLIISGHITREQALAALELKIAGFLPKPYEPSELFELVERSAEGRVTDLREDDELRDTFVADARTMIDEIEGLILQLERNPTDEVALDRIFACAHTIKGTSAFFRPAIVQKFMHRYEEVIAPLKHGTARADAATIQILLRGLDKVRELIRILDDQTEPAETLESMLRVLEPTAAPAVAATAAPTGTTAHGPAATPGAAAPGAAVTKVDEVRVDMGVLREFSEKSGEITVLRNMIDKLLISIEDEHAEDPRISSLASLFVEMSKAVTGIQDHIEDMKKVSLQPVIRPLHRTVRDLAGQLRKDLTLDVVGGDLRIDQHLAEAIGKCLVHLVRNSADHGVEDPATRVAAGKPAGGRITLTFQESNEAVLVRIADDGSGIDVDRVKRKAVEKNLIGAEDAARMPDAQARALIFEAGFSTAERVSDVSGRGVGMDMVKQTVQEIGGRIEIDSSRGEGTSFCLRLPLPRAVHIINALMVSHEGETFAIPRDEVDRIIDLHGEAARDVIRSLPGRDQLIYEGQLDAIFPFHELTGRHRARVSAPKYLIRVRARTAVFALAVEDVLGIEDIVVKPLAQMCRRGRLFRGATFVDDGRIGLVMDIDGIADERGLAVNAVASVDSIARVVTEPYFTFERGDGACYALPRADVFRVESLTADPRRQSSRQTVTPYQDAVIEVVDLRRDPAPTELWPMIVARQGDRLCAYLVASLGELIEIEPVASGERMVLHEERVLTLVSAASLATVVPSATADAAGSIAA